MFMATESSQFMYVIIGAGPHNEGITISLENVIHRKIKAEEKGTTFLLSAENLSAVMTTHRLSIDCFFN